MYLHPPSKFKIYNITCTCMSHGPFWKINTSYLKKTFPSECILNRVAIYICLQANKYIMYSVSEWVKIKYLLWILNTNYCAPDENYSRKHVYVVIFRVWFVSFGEAKKRRIYTANVALTNVVQFVFYTTGSMPITLCHTVHQNSYFVMQFFLHIALSTKI